MSLRNYINYGVFFLLVYSFVSVIISSYVLWFVLPRGQGIHGNEYCSLQGEGVAGNLENVFQLPRFMWIEIHSWLSVALTILVIIHIILHWRWICASIIKLENYISKRQQSIIERYITITALFFLFIVEILSGFVIWFLLPRGAEDYPSMISGIGRTFWGFQRNIWLDLHVWVAVFIIGIIAVHIIIHWRWLLNMTRGMINNTK
ncbi:MAG: DUF4405 domain-containing protein [Dehalococcoidales bacterium]|nr:DUF4405 domain-containing protein [Dehalococcoidales bacterium]